MEGCSVLEDKIEEIVGKEILDFIPKNKKDNIDGIIDGILSEDLVGINGFEMEILTRNGEKKNIECNISLIYDNKNIVTGFIMSGNDRTAEKILESEREILLLEMRGRIREIECLYSIAIFAQSGKELDSKFVDAILKAWKNPEKLSGRIILNNSEYRSSFFKRTNLLLEKKLYSNKEMIGRIEIFSEDKYLLHLQIKITSKHYIFKSVSLPSFLYGKSIFFQWSTSSTPLRQQSFRSFTRNTRNISKPHRIESIQRSNKNKMFL